MLISFPDGTDDTEGISPADSPESARHLEFDFHGAHCPLGQVIVKRHIKPLEEQQPRILKVLQTA